MKIRARIFRLLTGLYPKKVMTQEIHNYYIHLCGREGRILDALPHICRNCDRKHECLKDHAIKGVDW